MHGRRDPQKMAERHITSLDTNKDGKVSRQEFLARQSQAFSKADANSDGFVTAEEMAAQYEKHRAEMAAHHEGRKGARPGRGPDAERAAPAPAK
jgi:Ca2+-binding EF-hand superfamily protein